MVILFPYQLSDLVSNVKTFWQKISALPSRNSLPDTLNFVISSRENKKGLSPFYREKYF